MPLIISSDINPLPYFFAISPCNQVAAHPAKKGFILILKSSVNYVANSSMEVGVKIESENPFTGEIKHTASAYLTFVALDEKGKPREIPDIAPETDVEIRRYKEGKDRTLTRKKELK